LRRYAAARYGTGAHLVPGFPAKPAQIREARGFLAGLLGDRTAADDAVLCLSEVATNAIQHSRSAGPGGRFSVRAELDGEWLRVEVGDQGGPWTRLIHRDGLRGRGLLILAELAASWGRGGDAGAGWRVWFEMHCPVRPAGPKATIMPQAQPPDGTAAGPAGTPAPRHLPGPHADPAGHRPG
jgi:anti-sigma regulatory factor (Ser/Thr protein kinase)